MPVFTKNEILVVLVRAVYHLCTGLRSVNEVVLLILVEALVDSVPEFFVGCLEELNLSHLVLKFIDPSRGCSRRLHKLAPWQVAELRHKAAHMLCVLENM